MRIFLCVLAVQRAMKTRETKPKRTKKDEKNLQENYREKTAKMGGGTSLRSQPAKIARESSLVSLLVKSLHKNNNIYTPISIKITSEMNDA